MEIVLYSKKSFAIIGDTKANKEELRSLGGKYNSKLVCGPGYVFANIHMERIRRHLGDRIIACVPLDERRRKTTEEKEHPLLQEETIPRVSTSIQTSSIQTFNTQTSNIPVFTPSPKLDNIEEKRQRFRLLINRAKKLNKKLDEINNELTELYNDLFEEK